MRAHGVCAYGVRWRKPIVCTSRALLIHRKRSPFSAGEGLKLVCVWSGRPKGAPTVHIVRRLIVVGTGVPDCPFLWQTKLRLPSTGSCREATEGVPLINRCYLRTHTVRPYGDGAQSFMPTSPLRVILERLGFPKVSETELWGFAA